LGARGFFRAQCFDSSGFLARLLGGDGLELGGMCGRGFGRRRCCRRLLFRGSLHVSGLSAPANRFTGAAGGNGFGDWLGSRRRATAARGRRGSRLLLGASTLLTFPARADASDLVVGEHTHVAANGNVHLPKKRDDFFGGHCEFVRQLTD
jgi:hypothetical protein